MIVDKVRKVIFGLLEGVFQLLELFLAIPDGRAPTVLSIFDGVLEAGILQREQRECDRVPSVGRILS